MYLVESSMRKMERLGVLEGKLKEGVEEGRMKESSMRKNGKVRVYLRESSVRKWKGRLSCT